MQIKTHLRWFYKAQNWVIAVGLIAIGAGFLMHKQGMFGYMPIVIGIVIGAVLIYAGQEIAFRFVPVRCLACNGPAFPSVSFFQTRDKRISYVCRTCGHEHLTEAWWRAPG